MTLIVIQTERLLIRRATSRASDVDFFYRLWTCPEVMKNVGFPRGLRLTREQVEQQISGQAESEFDTRLVVELRASGEMIGECKLGRPDHEGIAETDVKLLPAYWQKGYGREIKQGLLDYLFTHTACRRVKATPNKENLASIRMQEAVGGRCTGEIYHRFPDHMKDYTVDVAAFIYMVSREEWQKRKTEGMSEAPA